MQIMLAALPTRPTEPFHDPAAKAWVSEQPRGQRRYVRQVLASVNGNKTHAARVLGIDRRSLYRRIDAAEKPARASAPGTGAAMPPGATGDGRVVDHQGQVSVAGPGETNRVGPRPATEPS